MSAPSAASGIPEEETFDPKSSGDSTTRGSPQPSLKSNKTVWTIVNPDAEEPSVLFKGNETDGSLMINVTPGAESVMINSLGPVFVLDSHNPETSFAVKADGTISRVKKTRRPSRLSSNPKGSEEEEQAGWTSIIHRGKDCMILNDGVYTLWRSVLLSDGSCLRESGGKARIERAGRSPTTVFTDGSARIIIGRADDASYVLKPKSGREGSESDVMSRLQLWIRSAQDSLDCCHRVVNMMRRVALLIDWVQNDPGGTRVTLLRCLGELERVLITTEALMRRSQDMTNEQGEKAKSLAAEAKEHEIRIKGYVDLLTELLDKQKTAAEKYLENGGNDGSPGESSAGCKGKGKAPAEQ